MENHGKDASIEKLVFELNRALRKRAVAVGDREKVKSYNRAIKAHALSRRLRRTHNT